MKQESNLSTYFDDLLDVLLSMECHEVHRKLLKSIGPLVKLVDVLHKVKPKHIR